MKVLKFGGTSVGSNDSIKLVGDILAQYHGLGTQVIAVVSAQEGVTNLLQDIGEWAVAGDVDQVNQGIVTVQDRHFDTVKALLPVKDQSHVLAHVKRMINELEEVIHGVTLLKELSPRSKDLILSFGERLSAYTIHNYLKRLGLPSICVDSRELIQTDAQFGSASVNFKISNKKIAFIKKTTYLNISYTEILENMVLFWYL